MFRRFIRRNYSVIRPTAGLGRNRVGGRSGFYFRRRFLFFGHPVASGSPVIIIAALTTKRSGPIRRHALWASRVRATGGERSFPLIMQNVHRYFLYLALLFILILTYDAWKALWFIDPATGKNSFGIGVGTIVLAINVVLAQRLYIWMPFLAASDRRISRSNFQIASLLSRIRLRELSESQAHALGVAESVLGRLY